MAASSAAVPHGKEALSKLDHELTCGVCWEHYTDLRTLPCNHSYCKDCINRLPVEPDNDGRHIVRCPICRHPTQLSEGGAAALPTLCHTHNVKQDFYCDTCEEHICFKCSTESHRDHQCDRAERLYMKHKQQIQACLQPVKERIVEVEQTLTRFDTREREMREQGKAVQKGIDDTYQQMMNQLQESRRKASQEAGAVLQEKLQLHSLEKSNVEAVLVQLKSCHEFVEEELRSRSQYQIQAAKKQLVKRIKNTHSEVKVSELQPAQQPNIAFTADKNTISACSHIGDITSKQSFSRPGLFSVDIPSRVWVDRQAEVFLTAPISLSASRLCCQLTPAQGRVTKPVVCPVTGVGEGQFRVMIRSSTAGLHQLRVLVDGVDIYGSPFSVRVTEWKRQQLASFAKGLHNPCGIAVTDDGQHVLVTECKYGYENVAVLSNTGKVVRRIGSHSQNEPGKIIIPWGVAVSADKHIFVVDNGGRLQKFSFSSAYLGSYNITSKGVAVHPTSGKVFCINKNECNITVLNADLTPSHSFGGNEFFAKPNGITIDTKGMVYVTDFSRGVVLKFTPEGEHLATISSKGEQPHQFGRPLAIAIDSNNIMYITDENKHKVMMFTTEGESLGSFSHKVERLRRIAVDKTGNVYVCDHSGVVLVSRP